MFQEISTRIAEHARNLKAVRDQFVVVPREGGGYPERAISHFFIRALMEAIQGTAVLEPSFLNDKTQKFDNHLDAIVFNDDVAILAEFKTAWAPSHWLDFVPDVRRVRRFSQNIHNRFLDPKSRQIARRLFGFYGTDAWRLAVAETWTTENPYKKWTLPDEFRSITMKRGFQDVWRDDKIAAKGKDYDDGHYLLYALEELSPINQVTS